MKKTRPRMERPFAVLEKKLVELESRLGDLFHTSVGGGDDEERSLFALPWSHEAINEDIKKRVAFLKHLLAAEMECHSDNTPAHFRHIAERLETLEGAFSNWLDSKVLPPDDDIGDLSTCSCNQDCFNEVEVGEEDNVPKPEDEFFMKEEDDAPEDVASEGGDEHSGVFVKEEDDAPEDVASEGGDEHSGEKMAHQSQCGGRRHSGFISVAIAAAAMGAMMGLAASFYGEEKVYLVPT